MLQRPRMSVASQIRRTGVPQASPLDAAADTQRAQRRCAFVFSFRLSRMWPTLLCLLLVSSSFSPQPGHGSWRQGVIEVIVSHKVSVALTSPWAKSSRTCSPKFVRLRPCFGQFRPSPYEFDRIRTTFCQLLANMGQFGLNVVRFWSRWGQIRPLCVAEIGPNSANIGPSLSI